MNMEEAQKIANKMSFEDAVYNALYAKCVPYRKATKIKLKELLDIAKDIDKLKEFTNKLYKTAYNKAIEDFAEKISTYGTYDYYGNTIDILTIAEQVKKEV